MTDRPHFLKASYFTLGCKLNFAETSAIGARLKELGIIRAANGDTPDICVVNTCSVTETADKKGRQLIRKIHHRWPEASIVVTGCYAQLKPQEVAELEGVDIVLGSNEKLKAAAFIDEWQKTRLKRVEVTPMPQITEFHPSCERGERTRWFLKVQDGCDYFCSYCTIPFARGRSRSGTVSQLTDMARKAAAEGGKEIVITGVNIGDFGRGNGETFFDLIRSLDNVEGIDRFRISSIEPNLLTEDIIRWTAREARAFMPHFHIPLQSGSDEVLLRMRRRYDTALFKSRIDLIREEMPDAFIGVDIIAGARGETPEEWEKSRRFAESLDVTRFHVFPYSERPGTMALILDNPVSQTEKHRRVEELTAISDTKLHNFMRGQKGSIRKVLWEHPSPGNAMHGFTDNYIRVRAPYAPELINTVTPVRLDCFDPEDADTLTATHL